VIGPFVIGRGEGCDLRISGDEYLSLRHAKVWQDDAGVVWIEDLGSVNGTFVRKADGQGIWLGFGAAARGQIRTQVAPGDVIHIGRTAVPWQAGTIYPASMLR
jgi:pSer/pThr/pTyr-binding forkhead associated (FHA) protein